MNRPEMLNRRKDSGTGFLVLFAIALLLIAALCWFGAWVTEEFFTVEVVGSSMEDTIEDGDVLYARRDLSPKRGDIVVVDARGMELFRKVIIKRVIGLGGDVIRCENGVVYRSTGGGEFELIDEPYKKGERVGDDYEFTVGEGEMFLLGDNRRDSLDSRAGVTFSVDSLMGVTVRRGDPIGAFVAGWDRFWGSVFGAKKTSER